MRIWRLAFARCSSGQSLVETALILPLVVLPIVLNAMNFGYFFLVVLNLTAAPRSGVEYSIVGSSSPGTTVLPPAGPSGTNTSVSYLTFQDMTGALSNPTGTGATGAGVQVCSKILGVTGSGASLKAKCASFGKSATFPAPGADPEAPKFVLNRVDVTYTFIPLIPGKLFNIVVLAACGGGNSCTFHRQVSMRAMD